MSIVPIVELATRLGRETAAVAKADVDGVADSLTANAAVATAKASVIDSLEQTLVRQGGNVRAVIVAAGVAAFDSELATLQQTPRFTGNVVDLAAYRAKRMERNAA